MRTTGYSLWIMPSGDLFQHLTSVIRFYSKKHKFPFFEPHVTLLGGIQKIDNIQLLRDLITKTNPFSLSFNKTKKDNFYFKSVYIEVEPSEPLTILNNKAKSIFDIQSEFKPHLSLVYGMYPDKIKKSIISNLEKEEFPNFTAKEVLLYKTDGFISDWKREEKLKLGN